MKNFIDRINDLCKNMLTELTRRNMRLEYRRMEDTLNSVASLCDNQKALLAEKYILEKSNKNIEELIKAVKEIGVFEYENKEYLTTGHDIYTTQLFIDMHKKLLNIKIAQDFKNTSTANLGG